MLTDQLEWAIGLGLLGAIVGSFAATIVVRWPAGRSVTQGRSRCDHCRKPLRARELVPVLSALVQRGRCRWCKARIDPTHRRVELLAIAIGLSAGWIAPGLTGIAGAVFGWLLLTLAGLDLAAFWLPDALTATLAAAGIAAASIGQSPGWGERLIGGIAGYGLLRAVGLGYRRWRGRTGMGGGDPKLFGAIGLWLGWRMLPPVLLAACLIGIGWLLLRRLEGKAVARTDALPLGALLAAAAYPAWALMVASPP